MTPSEPSDKTCRISDLDRQSQARQQLGAVLRDYNPAPGNYNPRVKLLAAEAHGQLGALDYVLATTTQSHQQYQRAATSYEQAQELSAGRPDRQTHTGQSPARIPPA